MKFPVYIGLLVLIGCKMPPVATTVPGKATELFSINTDTVFADEFIYIYKKNNINNDSAFTREDIHEYLDLYINFKLKIAEAKSRGMDTTRAFLNEFNTYKEQLKKPYLTENKVTEKLVLQAYDRYGKEINAAHILLQVAPEASPEDTVKIYNQLLEIRAQALSGRDFDALAKRYSDDPSAKVNGGELGYFTSFQMVYPFESAAYKTPEGEISMPVRTEFGYHIIKVLDKRPSQGSVKVSHIMIKIKPDKLDSLEARNKIFEIYDQAVGGVNWGDLVSQFSDDINTRHSGGTLRPFTVGEMPYAFQEVAFALQNPGDISDPVLTPFGWHIIRLEQRMPLPAFEDMEASIRSKVGRDSRAELNKKVLIERLKMENGFKVADDGAEILKAVGDALSNTDSAGLIQLAPLKLFNIGDRMFRVEDLLNYLQNDYPNRNAPEVNINRVYNNFTDNCIIAYEEGHLQDKYIDYRMLVKEYREGILLFELMEKEIWDKAAEDTVGLKAFYNHNKNRYHWEKRVKAVIYNSDREPVLSRIEKLIKIADSVHLSKKVLKKRFNSKTPLTLQIDDGIYERGDNEFIDQVKWVPGVYKVRATGRTNLIWIKEVLQPAPKALNEVKGLVVADYQNYLETLWVKALREKYPVNISTSGINYIYEVLEK